MFRCPLNQLRYLVLKPTCDAFHDVVLFAQFEKSEKHLWRSVTFKNDTPPWVFFAFFNLKMVLKRAKHHI